MNPLVLILLIALLIPAGLSWIDRFRTPMALVATGGLLLVLGLTYGLGPQLLPRVPELRPWGAMAALALATVGGGPAAAVVLAHAKRAADRDARKELVDEYSSAELAEMAAEGTLAPPPPPQLRGGKWIGILERLALGACLICEWPAGIPVVVAVKALGRYPELQAGTTERFIIGTLSSLLWALAACGVVLVR